MAMVWGLVSMTTCLESIRKSCVSASDMRIYQGPFLICTNAETNDICSIPLKRFYTFKKIAMHALAWNIQVQRAISAILHATVLQCYR
jgi:hypothetical protein